MLSVSSPNRLAICRDLSASRTDPLRKPLYRVIAYQRRLAAPCTNFCSDDRDAEPPTSSATPASALPLRGSTGHTGPGRAGPSTTSVPVRGRAWAFAVRLRRTLVAAFPSADPG